MNFTDINTPTIELGYDELVKVLKKTPNKFVSGKTYGPKDNGLWYMPDFRISVRDFIKTLHIEHNIVYAKMVTRSGDTRYCRACSECGATFDRDGNISIGYWIRKDEIPLSKLDSLIDKNVSSAPWKNLKKTLFKVGPKRISKALFWDWYNQYMVSEAWALKRQEAFFVHGTTCCVQDCSENASDVHHMSYLNVGHEYVPFDLRPVCRHHHNQIHNNRPVVFRPIPHHKM